MSARLRPVTVITKRLSLGLLDRLWQRLRRDEGIELLTAGAAARGALAALRRGRSVVMMIDQAPERRRATVRCSFLGAPARVDLAPALLAMRARVPLVIAFPWRGADGTHQLLLAAELEPPGRPSRAWAEAAMMQATRALERAILGSPEQWLWMHRRWKDAPGAATAFAPDADRSVVASARGARVPSREIA